MVTKHDSKLADSHDTPQIGEAQDAIADAALTGADTVSLAGLEAALDEIRDVLLYHGLIKA